MTVYLVRHGSAGARNGNDPNDTQRHLDPKGWDQAENISRHLGTEPVRSIYSSPLPRCVETVTPLAVSLGTEVHLDGRLAEGSPLDAAWSLLEETGSDTVVLCSHGDVIPELIARSQRRGMRICEPTGFSKGSVWKLQGWDGTRFAKGSWTNLR
jgi:8-oxo-dGTP diphosphatase